MPAVPPLAVLDQLEPIFREVLNQSELTVTRDSDATNTRNWDSFAHIELIELVEAHFKVRFALGELQDLRRVGDLVDLIVAKVSSR